jgi:hypothetical protein
MENKPIETEIESNDVSFMEGEVKVKSKFYDGTLCDFTISAKNVNNGLPIAIAKMFAAYFACLKLYPLKNRPELSEQTIEMLKPLALKVFKETFKDDYEGDTGKLLEIWTNQVVQLMQSGHGIH